MINNPDGDLHVYMLSVGQGDTSVIVSPAGSVLVIDATRPSKLVGLLDDLGLDGTIEHLIITHPHSDHFSGANSLVRKKTITEATLAPFWHEFGLGPPTYRQLVARLEAQGANTSFLSGYSRWYPDGALTSQGSGQNPEVDPDAPFLEMLGPANGLVRQLEDANVFNTNHLSIMTRLTWRNFRMVSAGDCQQENWSFFDSERLIEGSCQVMRAAHHGSQNGTQWERIDRLDPRELIVSSDPNSRHHLPDLTGAAIFAEFDSSESRMAVLTRATGTIHLAVTRGGRRNYEMFGEAPDDPVDLNAGTALDGSSNPTDWPTLLDQRVADL